MRAPQKTLLWLLLLFECLVTLALVFELMRQGSQLQRYFPQIIFGYALLFISLQLFIALYLKKVLFSPLASANRGMEIILNTHENHQLDLPKKHALGTLPQTIHLLGKELALSREEVKKAVQQAAQKSQLQQDNLARVIQSLEQGVLVCDSQARQLLYNPSAHRIFEQHPGFGLGKSLYDLLPRIPIEQSLSRFDNENRSSFISIVKGRDTIIKCRVGRLAVDELELKDATEQSKAFVLTFDDITAAQNRLQQQDKLFSTAIESLRSPLTNLRAAAENLAFYDDMTTTEKDTFSQVIKDESIELSSQLNKLASNERALVGQEWNITDMYGQDLVNIMTAQFERKHALVIVNGGSQKWLTSDTQALVALVEYLCLLVAKKQSLNNFEFIIAERPLGVYFDICWQGIALDNTEIESCINDKLATVVGQPIIGELINQLGGEIWSQTHPGREQIAMIRLPLPAPESGVGFSDNRSTPARPISYDFDLLEDRFQHTLLLNKPLSSLNFVVFDTETTGLHPEEGDEVISIAAVRIVNRRLLEHESFNQLVNPNRSIPASSIVFHGITEEMIADAPSFVEVLPQFKTFAKDAVLVAHNAWFDMAFIRKSEAQAKSYFPNPVVDTLMLSLCLHGKDLDHSLDAIANRLGVDIVSRHSALGDSITTANVLLSQIDMLEARGIITLKDALDSYH